MDVRRMLCQVIRGKRMRGDRRRGEGAPRHSRRRSGLLILAALAVSLAAPRSSVSAQAAQQSTVRGQVLEEATNRPLSGAVVEIQETGAREVSDQNGQFEFTDIGLASVTLQAQLIGYRSSSVTTEVGAEGIVIRLRKQAISLGELIVTGTAGETQRRAIGNTVSTVDAAEAQERLPSTDVTGLLNGRATGVVVESGTGVVGSGPRIRVRGASSVSLSDQPLVYVDGVRVNNDVATGPKSQGFGSGVISRLADFNPDDIESMQVIKGPAAATLYGTEASKGVLQIITKDGRPDEDTRFRLTVRQGGTWLPNPAENVPPIWGPDPETGQPTSFNLIQREADAGRPMWRTGYTQEYLASVSGGVASVGYYLSGKYQDLEGPVPTNELWRYNIRANGSLTLGDEWSLSTSLGFVKNHTQLAKDGFGGNVGGALFSALFGLPSLVDTPRRGFLIAPPEVLWQIGVPTQDVNRFTGSIELSHRPTEWFRQRLIVGQDETNEDNQELTPFLGPEARRFVSAQRAEGEIIVESKDVTYNTVDWVGTAIVTPAAGVESETSIGLQYYRNLTDVSSQIGQGFPGPGLTAISGTAVRFTEGDQIENVTLGSYLQERISVNNRLFLTAAVRLDKNSAFGENADFVAYPKASASWVISEESFWNVEFIDQLRLRGAWGQSGQQPSTFAAIRTFRPVTLGTGESGFTPQSVGNPELEPERGSELEVGFEASLLDDRVGLDFNFFHQKVTDAILARDLAPSRGFPGQRFENIGTLRNVGVETRLDGRIFESQNFVWDLGMQFALTDNEILDVTAARTGTAPNGADFIRVGTIVDAAGIHLRHQEGLPAGSWFAKKVVSAELDGSGTAINVMCDGGSMSQTPVPCSEAPFVNFGSSSPGALGSVDTQVSLFGRWTLSALVDFKLDVRHGDNDTVVRCILFGTCRANFFPSEYDPKLIAQYQSGGSLAGFAAANAAFARLRSVSLGVDMPEMWSAFVGAESARFTVSARNLALLTDWPGLDPETFWVGFGQFDKTSQTMEPVPTSVTASLDLRF